MWTRTVVSTVSLVAFVAAAQAQGGFRWPDEAENLQVLAPDTPPQQLRGIMGGFTRSLGVRCSYCHVGEEGAPLSTYDFVADDNPMKDRARVMLTMVEGIERSLEQLEPSGDERVNAWCHTCHRGAPKPWTLVEALEDARRSGGVAAAVARYEDLRERYHGHGTFDFSERSLIDLGRGWLRAERVDEAIEILELNVAQHPRSSVALKALGGAHAAAGHVEEAIAHFGAALVADPTDDGARAQLRQLIERSATPAATDPEGGERPRRRGRGPR